jgi:spore coat polysaccharide biosynthesis protein SpsF
VDPEAVKAAIECLGSGAYDYVYLGLSFAEGICCDLMSFAALELAYRNAKLQPEREHVTPYMHNHPELFKMKCLENNVDDSRYRFVVDEPEDFEVVKSIIEGLQGERDGLFHSEDIKRFLDEHRAVYEKNAHVVRNAGYDVFGGH